MTFALGALAAAGLYAALIAVSGILMAAHLNRLRAQEAPVSDIFQFNFGGPCPRSYAMGPVTGRPLPPLKRTIMAFALLDDQQTTLRASARDPAGSAVPDLNALEWTVDDPAVLTLTPAADGLSCLVVTTGKAGDAIVTVTDPVLKISDAFPVTVTPDAPSVLDVTADEPTSRLTPTPTPAPPA